MQSLINIYLAIGMFFFQWYWLDADGNHYHNMKIKWWIALATTAALLWPIATLWHIAYAWCAAPLEKEKWT